MERLLASVVFAFVLAHGAQAATLNCGAQVNGVVKQSSDAATFNGATFKPLSGAEHTVTIPAGKNRCVKVVLEIASTCSSATACHVRTRASGNIMPGGPQDIFTSTNERTSKTIWAKALSPGQHKITVLASGGGAELKIANWVMDVQVLEVAP